MLYFLWPYREFFSPLNLFQYITFRSGGAFLSALLMGLVLGKPFIGLLKTLRVAQTIRDYGPSTHLAKTGTPTMGGLLMLVSMGVSTFLWARLDNRFIWVVLISAVWLGALGFMDDYRKWITKNPGGISQTFKMTGQVVLGLGVSAYLYIFPPNPSYGFSLAVPYLKDVQIVLGGFYVALALLVVVGASNAVNITDGLDGLASGTLLVNALTFGVFAYLAGHVKFSSYLRLVPVSGAGELTVYLAAMAGACLAFLWYNAHPAEIFMGDAGSLFLGGTLGVVALCVKQELILILVGGVFVVETLSVLLQVGSVKMRKGKRMFRMAPLHHHYEMAGVPETKVTIRFWIVAMVLALRSLQQPSCALPASCPVLPSTRSASALSGMAAPRTGPPSKSCSMSWKSSPLI
jgi:phospho-N-acetylmuramoyl-pentapeptide-transferase